MIKGGTGVGLYFSVFHIFRVLLRNVSLANTDIFVVNEHQNQWAMRKTSSSIVIRSYVTFLMSYSQKQTTEDKTSSKPLLAHLRRETNSVTSIFMFMAYSKDLLGNSSVSLAILPQHPGDISYRRLDSTV